MKTDKGNDASLFLEGFYEGIPHHLVGDDGRAIAIIAGLVRDGKSFEKVLNDMGDDIKSAMRHDDPDVMYRISFLNEVEKKRNLIMRLAKEYDRRIEAGKKSLGSKIDAKRLFDTLIKYR